MYKKVSATYYNPYVFNKIDIPIEDLKDKSFTILDSSEGNIFINVNHHGPLANFGIIIISLNNNKKGMFMFQI